MNRKGILIGVLAALMLFAFTACENVTSADYIASAAVTGGGDTVYLPGETVDLSDYTFSLLMMDGSTKPASAGDFVFKDGLVVKPSDNKFVGYYKGMANQNFAVELTVNVGTISSLEIDAKDVAVDEYYAPTENATDKFKDDSINLEGLKVTATYTFDGKTDEREISLDNPYLQKTMKGSAAATPSAYTDGWNVSSVSNYNFIIVWVGEEDKTIAAPSEDTAYYAVDVVANPVTNVELKVTDGYQIFKDKDGNVVATTKAAYAIVADGKISKDSEGIYLEVTYANGEVAAVEETGNILYSANSGTTYEEDAVADLTVPGAGNLNIYGEYQGLVVDTGLDRKLTLEVPVINDSIVGIKAVVAAGADKRITCANHADDIGTLFTVNYVMASDDEGEATGESLTYGAEEDYTITAPTSFDFSKNLTGDKVDFKFASVEGGYTCTLKVELGPNA